MCVRVCESVCLFVCLIVSPIIFKMTSSHLFEVICMKLNEVRTQPMRPGRNSQKNFRSKLPIRGLSSWPMKKSYNTIPSIQWKPIVTNS